MFHSFLLLINVLKKNLLYDNLVLILNDSLLLRLLQAWYLCFLIFSIVFPKNALFISLKKSFSKSFFAFFHSFVFISMYDFSKATLINLITLCSFFKTNPWYNACFKLILWIIIRFFYVNKSFSIFSIFILSGKKGKSL